MTITLRLIAASFLLLGLLRIGRTTGCRGRSDADSGSPYGDRARTRRTFGRAAVPQQLSRRPYCREHQRIVRLTMWTMGEPSFPFRRPARRPWMVRGDSRICYSGQTVGHHLRFVMWSRETGGDNAGQDNAIKRPRSAYADDARPDASNISQMQQVGPEERT